MTSPVGAGEVKPYSDPVMGGQIFRFSLTGNRRNIGVSDPKQPREGFTMIDPEDDAELDEFCKTYEVADPETRRMIRVSFEVGIAQRQRG